MKRTVSDNSKTKFLKDLAQRDRSNRGKSIPRGFKFVVSENGTLMLKNLKTGIETPLA